MKTFSIEDCFLSEARPPQTVIDAERLDGAVTLLLDASRNWSSPDREGRLAIALEVSREMWGDVQLALSTRQTSLPLEVKNNLLIVSVYAQGKLIECEQMPSRERLASLIFMTRNLAASLREWRAAA